MNFNALVCGLFPNHCLEFLKISKCKIEQTAATQCLTHRTETPSSGRKGKHGDAGIKHMVTNNVVLENQKECWDAAPCVVIAPVVHQNFVSKPR